MQIHALVLRCFNSNNKHPVIDEFFTAVVPIAVSLECAGRAGSFVIKLPAPAHSTFCKGGWQLVEWLRRLVREPDIWQRINALDDKPNSISFLKIPADWQTESALIAGATTFDFWLLMGTRSNYTGMSASWYYCFQSRASHPEPTKKETKSPALGKKNQNPQPTSCQKFWRVSIWPSESIQLPGWNIPSGKESPYLG